MFRRSVAPASSGLNLNSEDDSCIVGCVIPSVVMGMPGAMHPAVVPHPRRFKSSGLVLFYHR